MREDLLTSAVSFLTSSKVQSADKEKKIQFLKKKGLDDEEIEEAFKRAGSATSTAPVQVKPYFSLVILNAPHLLTLLLFE
jgi:hypothetical protein